jgi:hypothetical protein
MVYISLTFCKAKQLRPSHIGALVECHQTTHKYDRKAKKWLVACARL